MEMTDILALDLVEKRIVTDQLTLNIAYDVLNLTDPEGQLLKFPARSKKYLPQTE